MRPALRETIFHPPPFANKRKRKVSVNRFGKGRVLERGCLGILLRNNCYCSDRGRQTGFRERDCWKYNEKKNRQVFLLGNDCEKSLCC